MFWDNLLVPSSEVKLAKKIPYIPWQKTEIMQLISFGDCSMCSLYQLCYAVNITVLISFGDCSMCNVYQLCHAMNIKMLCIIVIVAVQNSGSKISPCHVSLSL
jgi:hypothetical protein